MRAQGFTLIELLITLTIVAILAALAAPNMGEYIEQERVRGALVNLKQELAFARSEAIKRNTTIYISSTQGAAWCLGMSLSANCDCTIADPDLGGACSLSVNGAEVLRRITNSDYPGVSMDAAIGLEFDGVRGVASQADTLEMSSDNYSGEVVISLIGRVRACGNISGMEGC